MINIGIIIKNKLGLGLIKHKFIGIKLLNISNPTILIFSKILYLTELNLSVCKTVWRYKNK